GSLKNAINIHTPDFLEEDNLNVFKELKNSNKTVILFGTNPQETNLPFLLLYQLGYDNIKLLSTEIGYDQNRLITNNSDIETSKADVGAFIQESVNKQAEAMRLAKIKTIPKPKVVPAPKVVIPIKKKKKTPVEGGC
ncbi:hypothetical protein, partial [Algibacter sp.]|uniref:hypothetical protein n=1 Tax=Algibacter sp. TaxID=1872428 RepID=UPI003C77D858